MAKPNIPQFHSARKAQLPTERDRLAEVLSKAAYFDSVELSSDDEPTFFVAIHVRIRYYGAGTSPERRDDFRVDGRGYKLMKRRKSSNGEND